MTEYFIFPPEVWSVVGVVGSALLIAGAAIVGHFVGARRAQKADAGTLALGIANNLQQQIAELNTRVSSLESDRNAYRSWSHVLWDHIHDSGKPRLPAPLWPEGLSR